MYALDNTKHTSHHQECDKIDLSNNVHRKTWVSSLREGYKEVTFVCSLQASRKSFSKTIYSRCVTKIEQYRERKRKEREKFDLNETELNYWLWLQE